VRDGRRVVAASQDDAHRVRSYNNVFARDLKRALQPPALIGGQQLRR